MTLPPNERIALNRRRGAGRVAVAVFTNFEDN
jgi:hypothetical protein